MNFELISIYCIAVLGISFTIGGWLSFKLQRESKGWQIFPLFYTFTPALIAWMVCLIYQLPLNLQGIGAVFCGHWLYYLYAVLIPIAYLGLNAALQIKFGNYTFKKNLNWKELTLTTLVQQVFLIPFIAGEEIGWRGFLQNRLVAEYGIWASVLLLGIVWGLWHAPLAIKGYNLPKHPKFETFVFYPFVCICYSAIMIFLTDKTQSILAALLFHTTNNNLGGLSLLLFDKKNESLEVKIYFCIGSLILVVCYFLLRDVKQVSFGHLV